MTRVIIPASHPGNAARRDIPGIIWDETCGGQYVAVTPLAAQDITFVEDWVKREGLVEL